MQEFFQRQRSAAERNGVTVRRHQMQQNSARVSQDLMTVHAAKRSVQPHQTGNNCSMLHCMRHYSIARSRGKCALLL